MPNKPVKNKGKKIDAVQSTKTTKPASTEQAPSPTGLTPWISFKTGLIIITVCSLGMAILTATQYAPVVGWGEGILYGLLFGAMIWGVFFLTQVFFRWLRK